LAAAGVRSIALWDIESDRSRALVNRLGSLYPNLELTADVDHAAADRDIVVNATR
jgi:shikimate 5-dehydrogenase